MQRVVDYRERTQFDAKWGLWFWDNAMQSGADNNAALSNDPKDRSAILAVDASVYAMREYLAMAALAEHLGDGPAAAKYRWQATETRRQSWKICGLREEAIFLQSPPRHRGVDARDRLDQFSCRLVDGMLAPYDAQRMIRRHLLNPAEMRSDYGFRSLSKSDPAYNNDATIDPYSNWRGPIWINANLLDWVALRRYGFRDERIGWRSRWQANSIAIFRSGVRCMKI